ncbi:MAG: hypothetical protein QXX20_07975 [Candidatus Thermoplasmatota archaeon]
MRLFIFGSYAIASDHEVFPVAVNKINAFFFLSALNTWSRNYWNRPRILPKPIFGLMMLLPWLNFDLRPLLRPYQIHE